MAIVKTFRINPGIGPGFGVPDLEIREFISAYEKDCIVSVQALYIPPMGNADPRITIVVTKLDDLHTKEKDDV